MKKPCGRFFAAREYPAVCRRPDYDAEAAMAHLKKIIAGEAKPELPF
ncbi:MAG: hypothetical protein LBC79_06405 [Deltaproteobacteria bacterium]|jgi:hypothetical protein|nr:hypothetical protein [Deltaproteobacteria bacterium]